MGRDFGTVVAPMQATKNQWSSESHQIPARLKDYHPLGRPNSPSPPCLERQAEPSGPSVPSSLPGTLAGVRGCAATSEHICRVTLQGLSRICKMHGKLQHAAHTTSCLRFAAKETSRGFNICICADGPKERRDPRLCFFSMPTLHWRARKKRNSCKLRRLG